MGTDLTFDPFAPISVQGQYHFPKIYSVWLCIRQSSAIYPKKHAEIGRCTGVVFPESARYQAKGSGNSRGSCGKNLGLVPLRLFSISFVSAVGNGQVGSYLCGRCSIPCKSAYPIAIEIDDPFLCNDHVGKMHG